jgi:hypothetical protein
MKTLNTLLAGTALSLGLMLSYGALADDDLEVTMEVLDDVSELDAELMDVRDVDDGDDERGDGRQSDDEQRNAEERDRIDVFAGDEFDDDSDFDDESDERFEEEGRFEDGEEVDEDIPEELEDMYDEPAEDMESDEV